MKNLTCTFFGHRDAPDSVKPILRETLRYLIEQRNATRFYVGNQGSFDVMARSLLWDFESSHGVRFEIVLAYMPKRQDPALDPDHIVLPDGLEIVPRRFAIDRRNNWMLNRSDIVIAYVTHPTGGAAKYKKLADRKGKTVIDLLDPQRFSP